MSRFTAAYSHVLVRLREVQAILSLAKSRSAKPPTPASAAVANALCRGGVVLLSSHIEGFVEELADLAIGNLAQRQLPKSTFSPRLKYHFSRDLVNVIRESSNPDAIARGVDNLFVRDGYVWNASPTFGLRLTSTVFLAGFSNPTHLKIRKFFARFGYEDFSRDLGHRLAANYAPCTNMVDQVVDQRNKIAHGDAIATATPTDLSNMLALVRLYCRETDHIVASWFASKKCPIR